MPIRAICTICSDFFDHSKDVAAIHCGHTFHLACLTQWFQTAPNQTCPQCRVQVNKRTVIHKLFFDLAQDDEHFLDPESLKRKRNEIVSQSLTRCGRRWTCAMVPSRHCIGPWASQRCCAQPSREYENLKAALKTSGDVADKLRKDLISSKNKLKTAVSELDKTSEELRSTQKDLQISDKEILSLKKKLSVLQESLNLPSLTSETLSRLVLESPAPVGMPSLKLHRPSLGEDIDLNTTFNMNTPPPRPSGSQVVSAKKMRLEKAHTSAPELTKRVSRDHMEMQNLKVSRPSLGGQHWAREQDDELVGKFPSFIKNAALSKRLGSSSLLEPSKDRGAVRMGYDGLGGRTKYIQPTDPSTIRPLPGKSKAKCRVDSRPGASYQGKLDTFLR
ncbi:E3 ubiquitin-protein ligase TRAIP isoform X3 [Tachyglossus aculeatus]|uniref:E3 ubiquitin-protein ligase TRAIP isoform X3 n=1 Tax=Tachyglossus aculeatus TaxID=9261 RepID=UPI0018F3E0FD|nr:E3 ubiquitin-protein ligase TRAIP isoform X3 [Tachyglossus aculeatus]